MQDINAITTALSLDAPIFRLIAGVFIMTGIVAGIARQSLMAFALGIGSGVTILYYIPSMTSSPSLLGIILSFLVISITTFLFAYLFFYSSSMDYTYSSTSEQEPIPITYIEAFTTLKAIEARLPDLPRQWRSDITSLHKKALLLGQWIQENPEQTENASKFNSVTLDMLIRLSKRLVKAKDHITEKDNGTIEQAIFSIGSALDKHSERISSAELNKLNVDMEVIKRRLE